MIYRPERFEEVRGHERLVQFIRERIQNGTFPQFSLLYGEEGLGKTTLAKLIAMGLNCQDMFKPCYECQSCRSITEKVIRENKDTPNILTFKMSVDGGKEAVKDVLQSLNTNFLPTGSSKVIILEECHRMSDAAQDALLTDTEYLPKGVYIIACTTDITKMQKTFLSRAVQFNLPRLAPKELVQLLKGEASRRKLVIQGGDATYQIIVSWADSKPRAALNVLAAMGENCNVTMQDVKDLINFLDISKVIPIISSLAGSVVIGMQAVMDLPVDVNTHASLIEVLGEAVKFSIGQKSFKLSSEDNALLKEAVKDVPTQRLVQFMYEIASMKELTKQGLLASYLKAHPMLSSIETPNPEVLNAELNEKHLHGPEEGLIRDNKSMAPTLDNLLRSGKLVE